MQKWTDRAKQLKTREAELHSKMPFHVGAVLEGKRIILMKELAESICWPDLDLFDEMAEGFKLVGTASMTGVFKPQPNLAMMSEQELENSLKFLKPAILGKLSHVTDVDLQKELLKITNEEAEHKHWLSGPYSPAMVDEMFNNHWLPVKRFGVVQKSKVRPIDNLKESMLNLTFGSHEKIELKAMEHVLWTLVTLAKMMMKGGEIGFHLKSGRKLEGFVHPEWMVHGPSFSSTCIDLKSAYKQMALNPSEYHRTVVSLWDSDEGGAQCYIMRTLPFGAAASVHHFLRISYFLQAVGLAAGLCWGAYFDDFPTLTHDLNAKSTMALARGIFDLVGFKCSEDKIEPFGKITEMLGVELNTTDIGKSVLRVQNKASRVEELTMCVEQIFSDGYIDSATLPTTLGKFQFAEAQLWGRGGRIALADLRECTMHRDQRIPVDETVKKALEVLMEKIKSGKPRTIAISETCRPHLIFTDGSLEYDDQGNAIAQIGGVIITNNGHKEVFGTTVPSELLAKWQSEGKTHVIGLVELYAFIVALNTWKNLLAGQRVIIFTDSWPVYDVVVKGSSHERMWRELLLDLERFDEEHPMLLWVCRVPSSSNPADPPSRRDLSEIEFLRPFSVIDAVCPISQMTIPSYDM